MYMLLVFVLVILLIMLVIFNIEIKIILKIEEQGYISYLKVFFINIPIWKIDLTNKKKTKKYNNIKYLDKYKSDKNKLFLIIKDILSKSSINIEELNLKIDISTTDVILTSSIVTILSNLITFLLKYSKLNINKRACKYSITPLYIDKKVFNIKLNCIISINLVHIIYIIYKEWRGNINGRTASNRKSYGNCNE